MADAANEQPTENEQQFAIQRLYIKDLSVECPNSPDIFLENWEPELNLDMAVDGKNELSDGVREVILTVTVTVKVKDKTAFLVEVKQAGIFTVANFPEDEIKHLLGSFCPNILYPYAREVITDAIVKAGFPQLYLAPVNFDALFEQEQGQSEAANA
ncbi:MAG: protein-export chaperone SecB [Coxiella sp. (in: Bacteria)]|nr:MAG: protein-export chaperone SecB [Coxiella sp. (in: g-proteobacteria)]